LCKKIYCVEVNNGTFLNLKYEFIYPIIHNPDHLFEKQN